MRPIPLFFLINTVQYCEVIETGRYEGSFADPITITNCLVNVTKTVAKTNPGNQSIEVTGTLYLDATNTVPFFEMKYGSKIIDSDGSEYTVKGVRAIQTYELHHYAVDLM